jgi:S-adenosylmethionine-diacylgycerolhomoserine-N-methlytransferase
MASTEAPLGSHAALMDSVYRGQRHIYDLTRKYYLFGRDRLIAGLDCRPGDKVLEIACGTGRNLAMVRKTWPDTRLYGVDISAEMLKSARGTLGASAKLAGADARDFDPLQALGEIHFDRVILSYSLSMIPGWERALAHAATLLAPGGSLHIVDFGDLGGIPSPLARGLRAWLARFHVEPRTSLPSEAKAIAGDHGLVHTSARGPLGYYLQERLQRVSPAGA